MFGQSNRSQPMKAQHHTLASPLLSQLSQLVSTQIGLYFPRERWDDLERGMVAAAEEFGFAELEACVRWLLSASLTDPQIAILAGHLTIGETYFFRDQKSFEALEHHVLPDIISSQRDAGRRIQIWCAGCCTGEEPYSIAMLLDRLLPDSEQWNITILGTDINPHFLHNAEAGIYGEWSFRNAPSWVKQRYFTRRQNGRFEIHPHMKERVKFSYLNLVGEEQYPWASCHTSGMNLILCRNVLMYFNTERAARVVANLYRAAADRGWVIVSSTETSQRLFPNFSAVNFPGAVFYRKDASVDIAFALQSGLSSRPSATPAVPVPEFSPIEITLPLPGEEPESVRLPIQTEPIEHLRLKARLCANQGKLAEAAAWCTRAIDMDKLNPYSYYLLATIQKEIGLVEDAERSLSDTIYLAPDFPLAHFALGNLYLGQGRRASAERYFATTLALLRTRRPDEILAESEGMPAGRLMEMVAGAILAQAANSEKM